MKLMWLALAAAVGCEGTAEPRSRRDAGGDATAPVVDAAGGDTEVLSSPDANVGDAGSFVGCPPQELASCPATPFEQWHVLLDAADFGAGAQLTAIGGDAVLVRGGDARWLLVGIGYNDEASAPPPRTVWRFPAGDWSGIDVTSAAGERFRGVFALACEASVCRLLRGDAQRGSDAGASELVDVPGSQLPEGIEARGLAFDSALDALCVFGNALACFGDAWTTPIAPTSGLEILEVSGQLGEVTMIALGAQGRWWKRVASASGGLMVWAEQPALEQTVLTGAAVADERAVLFGPEQWWLVADRALTSCSPSQGTMGVFLRAGTPFTEFVTSDGRVVAYRLEEPLGRGSWRWCTTQQLELGGEPAIGRASAACRASLNSRLLTASRLVGTTLCVVLN